MKCIYQVTIKNIMALDNGLGVNQKGEHLLSLTLEYPREGVQSIETIKIIKGLKENEKYSFSDKSFKDKLVFKESIQGSATITAKLIVVKKPKALTKVLKGTLKAGALAAIGLIGIGGSIPVGTIAVLTGLTKGFTESIFDLNEVKDKIDVIGEVSKAITNKSITKNIPLHLLAKKDFVYSKKKGEEIKKYKLSVGDGVINVNLKIEKIYIDPKITSVA